MQLIRKCQKWLKLAQIYYNSITYNVFQLNKTHKAYIHTHTHTCTQEDEG